MRFITSALLCLAAIQSTVQAWSTTDISSYRPDIDYTTHANGYPAIIDASITNVEWVEDLTSFPN